METEIEKENKKNTVNNVKSDTEENDSNRNKEKSNTEYNEIDEWSLIDLFISMKDHCRNQGYNLLDDDNPNSFIQFCKRTSTCDIR